MVNINSVLTKLNQSYDKITDLIPNLYHFTDDWDVAIDEFDVQCSDAPFGNFLYRTSNGKLIWCGISGGSDVGGYNIRRFNADYSLDTSFNPPIFDDTGNNGFVRQVGEQSDGKLIVVGNFYSVNDGTNVGGIVRLNTNGTLDTTFNTGNSGFDNWAICVKVLDDDKILVGGTFNNYNGSACDKIIKLNSDGSVDGSFSSSVGGDVLCIEVDSNDDIYIGGNFTNNIIRLNSDGTTDAGFNVGAGFDNRVQSIKIDSNGKVVVGGWFTQYDSATVSGVCRIGTDGVLDNTFNVDGSGFSYYDGNQLVQNITIQSNGKILVGGWFDQLDGNRQTKLVRLNTNGTKDTTFDIGYGFNYSTDYWSGSRVQNILINNDGSILVTGSIYAYQNKKITAFAKLSIDGTLNESVTILKYSKFLGIGDGSNDMYDSGNFLNTNLTQLFDDADSDDVDPLLSIPNTHQSAMDDDAFENANDNVFEYTPTPSGQIKTGDDYFGTGSKYFTNMYPGMFVMVATGIDIEEFSITGDLGSDDSTDLEVQDIMVNGSSYACFMKTNIESGGDDPTVNHIILVPGSSDGITHLTNVDEDEYDDDCVQGINGRDHIYYILFSTFTDPAEMVSFTTCQQVAEKFLSIVTTTESIRGCSMKCKALDKKGFGCKLSDTTCTCAQWRYESGAYIPAIVVCNQKLI